MLLKPYFEDQYTIKLKSLKRLENLIKKSPKLIYEKSYHRAVRTIDGTYKTRTHNIDLRPDSCMIGYEGSNSKWFFYDFESAELAKEWWNKHIKPNFI